MATDQKDVENSQLLKDAGDTSKIKTSRSKLGHRKKTVDDDPSSKDSCDRNILVIDLANSTSPRRDDKKASPRSLNFRTEKSSSKSSRTVDKDKDKTKSKSRPTASTIQLGKASGSRKASHTWDPQMSHTHNEGNQEETSEKHDPNHRKTPEYKIKASTWSFEKMVQDGVVSDGERISRDKQIDVEWLGKHIQLLPDQNTYEDLVADIAKEFSIDVDFMNVMFVEFAFKSLQAHGKKKKITSENFSSEYKKVRSLIVSVVDQPLPSDSTSVNVS